MHATTTETARVAQAATPEMSTTRKAASKTLAEIAQTEVSRLIELAEAAQRLLGESSPGDRILAVAIRIASGTLKDERSDIFDVTAMLLAVQLMERDTPGAYDILGKALEAGERAADAFEGLEPRRSTSQAERAVQQDEMPVYRGLTADQLGGLFEEIVSIAESTRDFLCDAGTRTTDQQAVCDLRMARHSLVLIGSMADAVTGCNQVGGVSTWATFNRMEPAEDAA